MADEREFSTIEYSAEFGALAADLQTLYEAAHKSIDILDDLAESMAGADEAGSNLSTAAEASARSLEARDAAFEAMTTRLESFVQWAAKLPGVTVNIQKLAAELRGVLAGSPLGVINFQSTMANAMKPITAEAVETKKVMAEIAADTKRAFDASALSPFENRLNALNDQLQYMQKLENELLMIGMKRDIGRLAELGQDPRYAALIGNAASYKMQPQTYFEPKYEGDLSQFDKLQAKVASYNQALVLVRDAQEIITASVKATGAAWEGTQARMIEIATQIKIHEDGIQAIGASTSQVVTKNDQVAASVNKQVAANEAYIGTLREEFRQLQANAAISAMRGTSGTEVTAAQLAQVPWHPSSLYDDPQKMVGNLLRSLIQQQLGDPKLLDALTTSDLLKSAPTIAQQFGTKMHTLIQASLNQYAKQFGASYEGMLQTEVPLKGVDEMGREWVSSADVVDRQRKIVADFKTYGEKSLSELRAFADGEKAWGDLTESTRKIAAQVTQYAKQVGATYQAMIVRMPTNLEVQRQYGGKESAAIAEVQKQFLAGAGPLVYKIPKEKVDLEEAYRITEASRAVAVESAEYKELATIILTAAELNKQRLETQRQLTTAVKDEVKAAPSRFARPEVEPTADFEAVARSFRTLQAAALERQSLAGTGDVAALEKMNMEEQRGLATLERKVALSKSKIELMRSEGYGANLRDEQIAQEIDGEEHVLAALKLQKSEKEAINRLTKEAESIAKAVQKAGVVPVVVPGAVGGEGLAPYEQRTAALIQQVEGATGKARQEAIVAIEQERLAYQRLIGQLQVGVAPLSKDAELKRQAADAAMAHAKALDLDAAAAEKQLLATLSSVGTTQQQMDEQRVVADTKRNAAASANANATALQKEAGAAQVLVGAQRQQMQGLTQLRTVLHGVSQQYGENTKEASNWMTKMFSFHKIIQVFWGSLLAQIAYGTMGAVQQFVTGSADLFIKFEANLTRFQVAVRSTQRAVAEGFAGADITQTVGEFVGTVAQWTTDLDAFRERWKVFTSQDVLAGFKEFLNISRANNFGRVLSLQLMDVAAALTLVEDEFANDLPKAMQAVARASDGYVRPLGATFIGMISDVDRNIKAMQLYGDTYERLGEGSEVLKKQQQTIVDTSIILERYNRVASDTSYLYDTIDLKIRRSNAAIQEQQILLGSNLAPAWLAVKNAIVGVLEGLNNAITGVDKFAKAAIRASVVNPYRAAILGAAQGAAVGFGKLGPIGLLYAPAMAAQAVIDQRILQSTIDKVADNNKDRRDMLRRWAETQALLEGKTAKQLLDILTARPKEVIAVQGVREQFQGLVAGGKQKEAIQLYDEIAAATSRARTELARLIAEGKNPDLIVAMEEELRLREAQIASLKSYSKTLSDADVVAQHLKDTNTEMDWTPEGAGINVSDVMNKLEDAWEDYQERRQDAMDERNEKLVDSWNKFWEDMADAEKTHSRNLIDIARDTADAIVDAFHKAAYSRADAYRNYLDSVEGENEDYALRLAELDAKQNEDNEKEYREHLQKLEELEIEHLRNLRDMQAQYEFDLTGAAEERDARKVLELTRRHEFDVQQEGIHYQDRIEDENRRFAQMEADRAANDARERARLEREHKKRLADLKLEYEHRLEEIKRALLKEIEDIREKEKRKIQDEAERWAKEKVEVAAKYAERNADIAEWLEDQYKTIERAYQKQVEAVLGSLNKQVEWTQDRMGKLWAAVNAALGPSGTVTKVYDWWFAYIERRQAAISAWRAPALPTPPVTHPNSPNEPAPSHPNSPNEPAPSLSKLTPTSALPKVNTTTTYTAVTRQELDIKVTADSNFSQGFEDALIDKITEVIRAI